MVSRNQWRARETAFLFQRLSVTVQRFNAVILHDSFPTCSDLWPSVDKFLALLFSMIKWLLLLLLLRSFFDIQCRTTATTTEHCNKNNYNNNLPICWHSLLQYHLSLQAEQRKYLLALSASPHGMQVRPTLDIRLRTSLQFYTKQRNNCYYSNNYNNQHCTLQHCTDQCLTSLMGMSDEWQNRPILSADKMPDKNPSCVMQKSPDFVCHVLSSTILSADFSYIGPQILFMLPWWLFATEDEYLF